MCISFIIVIIQVLLLSSCPSDHHKIIAWYLLYLLLGKDTVKFKSVTLIFIALW